MRAKYRINWKSGMRLSDAVFVASDEFHLAQLAPLYELMLRDGYGHLVQPRFRCDVDNAEMSVIEMTVTALSPSGDLLQVSFDHNERDLYQKMAMPTFYEPFIVYLEVSNSVVETFSDKDIPYRDKKYSLIFKSESLNYSNPDAVPIARFEYKQCWMMDSSFIPPCMSLRANADLWNFAHLFLKTLKELIESMKEKMDSDMSNAVMCLLPGLSSVAIEVEKEIDEMTPKHLTTLMQQVIGAVVGTCALTGSCDIPERNACEVFVNATYTPVKIEALVHEGIRLAQILNHMVSGFLTKPVVAEKAPNVIRPQRQPRVLDTSSERKSFKSKK